ncbi:MAG: hypothetical protein WBB45_18230 [Cyclobacteriaceae bacterium]
MKKILLLVLCTLVITGHSLAQLKEKEPRHTLHLNVGTLVLYGAATFNYEGQIATSDGFIKRSYIRVRGGLWGAWAASGLYGQAGLTGLTGAGNSHFEMHLGIASMFEVMEEEIIYFQGGSEIRSKDVDYLTTYPSASLGYRYQKPTGHFIFRAGIGWPDGVYLGLGVRF